jgi:hypothetical protein
MVGERIAPADRQQGVGLERAWRLGPGFLVHDGSLAARWRLFASEWRFGGSAAFTPAAAVTVNPLTSNGNRFEMQALIEPAASGRAIHQYRGGFA